MTVPATTRRAGPFLGNGAATSFPFTFKTTDADEVQVVLLADGVETTLVKDSDYSVTLNADQDATPGGSITYPISGTPLQTDESVTIAGAVPYSQDTDLPTGGNYSASVVENALDRAVIQIQQLAEQQSRTLRFPLSGAGASPVLPPAVTDNVLGWAADGSLTNFDPTELTTVVAFGTAKVDVFTGDGTTTAFTLTASPGVLANLRVSVGGVVQTPTADYTWPGGTTLSFTSAPPSGVVVLAAYMQALPQGVADSAASTYVPAISGVPSTTVQSMLRESITSAQAGLLADWNGTAGTDNSTKFLAALAYCEANRKALIVKAGRYSVGPSGVNYTTSTGNDLEVWFEPGVELVCTYAGASYPAVLQINGIGARCKVIGHKTQISYATAPSSRGSMHAVYLYGGTRTMTDLVVRGLTITNSPNFGLAVYAGPFGGVASGNKNVWIDDVEVIGSKGDGIHVENFDSGVRITNWRVESPGDDTVCVSNYTGSSGASTKSTPTTDVEITGGHSVEAYSAVVRLLGVQRCNIAGLRGTMGNTFGGSGASVLSCDETTGDYSVNNTDVTLSDVVMSGGAGVIYYSAGGLLSGVKIRSVILRQQKNYGVRLLQSAFSVGSKINNVTIDGLLLERATNSGVPGDVSVWVDHARSVHVSGLTVVNAPSVASFISTDRCSLEFQADSCGASASGSAVTLTSNTNIELGRFVFDGSCSFSGSCVGVTATGNTNTLHTGLWDMTGVTSTKLSRSSNTGTRGYCQVLEASTFLGTVTAGSSSAVTLPESMLTGGSYNLQTTCISDQGTRWGTTGMSASGFNLLWTDAQTNVRYNYVAATNVGY